MSLQDQRGNMYSKIMDNMQNFHIFSIYKVPFESVRIFISFSFVKHHFPLSYYLFSGDFYFSELVTWPFIYCFRTRILVWTGVIPWKGCPVQIWVILTLYKLFHIPEIYWRISILGKLNLFKQKKVKNMFF